MLRRGRVGQGVAVGVREEHPHRALPGLLVVGDGPDGERAATEGGAGSRRRAVGRALAGGRPRAVGLLSRDGADPHLVRRASLEVGEVDARRRGRQVLGLLVVVVGDGVVRPGGGVLTLGGLPAVLHVVGGDGQAVGGRRPRRIQCGVRGCAERGAGNRRRRRSGLHVGHLDEDLDGRGVAVDRVVHLASVELREYHARRIVFDLPVGIVRLVVDRRARLHADLARGRVDDEQSGVGGVTRQRVGQRDAVVRRASHRVADGRARCGPLGNLARGLRGDRNVRAAGD